MELFVKLSPRGRRKITHRKILIDQLRGTDVLISCNDGGGWHERSCIYFIDKSLVLLFRNIKKRAFTGLRVVE